MHILLHIPHSSTAIPLPYREELDLSERDLESELLRLTDWHTDELLQGQPRLVFPVSRLLVDPERFRDDAEEPMAQRGMGAVYTKTSSGSPFRRNSDREGLLAEFYDAHHAHLNAWALKALRLYGRGLIVDCHSMPSLPLPCDLDQKADRPDIGIGTDPFHTPEWLMAAAIDAFEAQGWSVTVDRPYAGTMVPSDVYKRESRIHSFMVEVNRRMYMNEATGERLPEFREVRRRLSAALDFIFASWLRHSEVGK